MRLMTMSLTTPSIGQDSNVEPSLLPSLRSIAYRRDRLGNQYTLAFLLVIVSVT